MSEEHVEALIVDACELIEQPQPDVDAALSRMITLRVELLEVAATCESPDLVDDCCGVAAQLEERLAQLEVEPPSLATPA